jgi:hypothetical protein
MSALSGTVVRGFLCCVPEVGLTLGKIRPLPAGVLRLGDGALRVPWSLKFRYANYSSGRAAQKVHPRTCCLACLRELGPSMMRHANFLFDVLVLLRSCGFELSGGFGEMNVCCNKVKVETHLNEIVRNHIGPSFTWGLTPHKYRPPTHPGDK